MKKIFISIFAFVYLVISSGFTLHVHYCMQKQVGWTVFPSGKDKCGVCGMHKGESSGCCNDEQKVVKFTYDQKSNDSRVAGIQPLAPATIFTQVEVNSFISFHPVYSGHNHLPPLYLQTLPVFLLNRNFRI